MMRRTFDAAHTGRRVVETFLLRSHYNNQQMRRHRSLDALVCVNQAKDGFRARTRMTDVFHKAHAHDWNRGQRRKGSANGKVTQVAYTSVTRMMLKIDKGHLQEVIVFAHTLNFQAGGFCINRLKLGCDLPAITSSSLKTLSSSDSSLTTQSSS